MSILAVEHNLWTKLFIPYSLLFVLIFLLVQEGRILTKTMRHVKPSFYEYLWLLNIVVVEVLLNIYNWQEYKFILKLILKNVKTKQIGVLLNFTTLLSLLRPCTIQIKRELSF